MMEDIIRKKLREAFMKEAGEQAQQAPVNKAPEQKKQAGPPLAPEKEEKSGKALYASVSKMLKNPMLNHAEIIRQLWADSDNASARSLFRKKLEQEKMTNGEGHYQFTMDELIKIANIINKAGESMVVGK